MEFKSQIATTPQQSKRLLELGLKKETADCMYSVMTVSYNGYYIEEDKRHYTICLFNQDEVLTVGFCRYEKIPAWSLHRLIEMSHYYDLYFCMDSPYDGVIDHIEFLIENNEFNSEYLEEKK